MKRKRPYVQLGNMRLAVGCGTCANGGAAMDSPRSVCYRCFTSGEFKFFKLAPEFKGKIQQEEATGEEGESEN